MILRPITDGAVLDVGVATLTNSLFAGALVSSDGNQVTVTIRENDSNGFKIYELSTTVSGFYTAMAAVMREPVSQLHYTITGTPTAKAQLYEWVA